ncbi:hypothetical protein JCM19294_1540 [Nonlabens tegetincola]|uniref:Uncharacterized protein n=1 Tax=Nonlabens tegetincola TaxID=323273 RepID=A0A090Q858_9FLAO|nr:MULTISPECIES: hypothetical protein [Nonlabens]ARN70376.1 hypothetical protein BST91_01260 [Nonlabens tegetincola]MEE2801864.1 hypothetical protein [Bacteroidota bacterium]PQJ19239.1 hypothetical protein BST93_05635 [Nonlabens tegetincola]GAK97918.1 hypothetical protein JCM19294_1540 [Nonlabens tegetincola]
MKQDAISFKRVIIDYKKLNDQVLQLLVDRYPDGYDDRDIISFRNKDYEWVDCVEVRTHDTIYLVKISKRLQTAMEAYESDVEEEDITNELDDSEDSMLPENEDADFQPEVDF